MPCRFASSGTVASSRSASRAILALNVASNFLRDLVIAVLHGLRHSRTLHTLTFGPISGVHFSMQTIVTHQICSSFEIAHPHPRWRGRLSVWSSGEYYPACGQSYGPPQFKEFTKSAGSRRRALLRWVQIALKRER